MSRPGRPPARRRLRDALEGLVMEPAGAPPPARAASRPEPGTLILSTELAAAGGGLATAAGVAVAIAEPPATAVLAELAAPRGRRPTTLASHAAGEVEAQLREAGFDARARGRLCWLALEQGAEGLGRLGEARPLCGQVPVIAHVPPQAWSGALEQHGDDAGAGLLRADTAVDRPLVALAVTELRERGLRARVATRPLGRVGSRRALAGLEPGGVASERGRRLARGLLGERSRPREHAESGQALPLMLGAAFVVVLCALLLAALGGALTGAGRAQRAADLVALSTARSLRDDLPRVLTPPELPDGRSNPAHLEKAEYLARAIEAGREAAQRNGVAPRRVAISFPDHDAFAPLRARVELSASIDPGAAPGSQRSATDRARDNEAIADAEAQAAPPAGTGGAATMATGGGYSGPLAYRQGKPMRPDVAAAFDRLQAAARRDGVTITITSAFRSDAEQAALFQQNPDPRWVAPPGKSLHRCATELDLGPSSAYGWLAANAPRFGFVKRYSWEPWHFGYERGPEPCSAAAAGVATDGASSGAGGLPAFVPERYREVLARAAGRWNVSVGLLAAQIMAESNFNPFAVSPAGAQGIAQFMPATAAAYGLDDPFDADAAIDAQAHLMSNLLDQFDGSVQLALAAYNAGPGAVEACGCVPPYPETQAYVARILALLGGAGELAPPTLEVRLVA